MNITYSSRVLTGQCSNHTHSIDLHHYRAEAWGDTLCAAKVFRSAWIPAPPDGSEPAIVRTAGAGVVEDMANGRGEQLDSVERAKRLEDEVPTVGMGVETGQGKLICASLADVDPGRGNVPRRALIGFV